MLANNRLVSLAPVSPLRNNTGESLITKAQDLSNFDKQQQLPSSTWFCALDPFVCRRVFVS